MAKSEQFNASINFGASLDGSMARTLKSLTGGIEGTERVTLKAMGVQTKWMREMQEGSASTVTKLKNMEGAMGALVKKQASLEHKIRAGVRAGEDVSKLAAEYKQVATGISRAENELTKLNAERKKEIQLEDTQRKREERNKLLRGAALDPYKKLIGAFTGAPQSLAMAGASAIGALPAVAAKTAAAGVAGTIGGALTLAGGYFAANNSLAEDAGIAKSYGLSYEKYRAGTILAQQAGLEGENFGDLTEELSNKVGEQGNEKSLNPMLGQIGLLKSRLGKLSKEKQFDTVMQAITTSVRSGRMTSTQGESLADQLMGGEANKLLTYILQTNKSYAEVMADAAKLQNISNAEAEGAVETSRIFGNIWTAGKTALLGLVGEVSRTMEPQLKMLEGTAIDWINKNKETIAKAIADWGANGGPERLIQGLKVFGEEVLAVGERLKWLLPDESADQKTVLKTLAQTGSEDIAANVAHKEGLDDWFNQRVRGNSSLFRQVQDAYTGSRGLIFDDDKAFDNSLDYLLNSANGALAPDQPTDASGSVVPVFSRQNSAPITQNQTFNFSVTLAPGSPADMAQSLHDQMKQLLGGNGVSPTIDIKG